MLFEEKYKLMEQIHQGQMSSVYLGKKISDETMVVVKCAGNEEPVAVSSLQKEVEILSGLHMEGIPEILDVFHEPEQMVVVMEYMEGKTLKQLMKDGIRLNTKKIQQIGIELCNILLYLQEQEPAVIHRDIKLENILYGRRLSLIDFGAARQFNRNARQDTVCLGTLGFAAPEQFGGNGQSDVRTDIYGVGKTLGKLVETCGNHNFRMRKVIEKCTRRDPQERYQSIEELMGALWSVDMVFGEIKKIVAITMVQGDSV